MTRARLAAGAAASVLAVGAAVVGVTVLIGEPTIPVVGTGTGTPTATATPGPSFANLWIDKDGGTCTRLATPVAYADRTACLPPNRGLPQPANMRGWDNAQNGDLVLVVDPAGSHDYPTLTLGPGSKTVTYRAASGQPSFNGAALACDNCTVDGFKFWGQSSGPSSAGEYTVCNEAGLGYYLNATVAICGVADILNFEVDGENEGGAAGCPNAVELSDLGAATPSNGVQLVNGSIHGYRDAKGFNGGLAYGLVDGVHFYDITRPATCNSDPHTECLWVSTLTGSTIRNSRFIKCPTQGILVSNLGNPDWTGFTLEGNLFTHSVEGSPGVDDWHSSPMGISASSSLPRVNWTVRYNTFETTPGLSSAAGSSGSVWYGNLGGAACGLAGFTYHHNVGETCGGESSVALSPAINTQASPNRVTCWTDAPNSNFALTAGCPASGAGDPRAYPTTDLLGTARTSPPDAGAYERPEG
jgi:hypothetical protein